ncbi:MAG: hypothetical protein ACE1ZZ_00660, partial [Dehalococcoidia bacterium]
LGMAVLPQQFAHAAPKSKPVACKGPSDALECGRIIQLYEIVTVKATTQYGDCNYKLYVEASTPFTKLDGSLHGEVNGTVTEANGKAKPGQPDPCEMLGIGKGGFSFFGYAVKVSKKGGKKK